MNLFLRRFSPRGEKKVKQQHKKRIYAQIRPDSELEVDSA